MTNTNHSTIHLLTRTHSISTTRPYNVRQTRVYSRYIFGMDQRNFFPIGKLLYVYIFDSAAGKQASRQKYFSQWYEVENFGSAQTYHTKLLDLCSLYINPPVYILNIRAKILRILLYAMYGTFPMPRWFSNKQRDTFSSTILSHGFYGNTGRNRKNEKKNITFMLYGKSTW